jgi:hypothetical protein
VEICYIIKLKGLNMDLTNHIDDLLNRLEEKLEFSNWKRKDKYYWENGKSGYFAITPDLLEYEENGKFVTKIWFKIRERAFSDESKKEFFDVIKPFKDEDYSGPYYWINPDYPKGYWYNHTL